MFRTFFETGQRTPSIKPVTQGMTSGTFLAITDEMTEALKRRLKQVRFTSPQQEALLSVAVAAGAINDLVDGVCERHGLTRSQYNVLRILRGAPPEGHSRCEVACRMIERAPDITRLVDRLQARGLVRRTRGGSDQRQAIARITAKGLRLLETIQPELDEQTSTRFHKLSDKDCHELSRLCALIFDEAATCPETD
jgi:DNA-binding MarR family transcriptional regulator